MTVKYTINGEEYEEQFDTSDEYQDWLIAITEKCELEGLLFEQVSA